MCVCVFALVHSRAHHPRSDDDVWGQIGSLRSLLPPQHRKDRGITEQAVFQTTDGHPQQTPWHFTRQVFASYTFPF